MLAKLFRNLRTDPLRRRVEASIKQGIGLSKGEWLIAELPFDGAARERLTAEMVEWCQHRIAESRRPYGIDQMALAVACAVPGGKPLASASFGVFRPVEFYAEGGVGDRLGQFVDSLNLEELNGSHTSVRFAAALFSWGDVARDTIFADADVAA